MGIVQSRVLTHWNYFLALEADIESIARFIEPSPDNYSVYSQELARLLMSSSAEVDVLLKSICNSLCPNMKAHSINQYRDVLIEVHPKIIEFKVLIPRWGLELEPFANWARNCVPLWWTANNKVKHHRDSAYDRANLKNALNSLAALYIVNLYYYFDEAFNGMILPGTRLLRASSSHSLATVLEAGEIRTYFNL